MENNRNSKKRQRKQGRLGKPGVARAPRSLPQEPRASHPQILISPISFLIANLELEFHLSPIRINELRFSNRKFFAIFHRDGAIPSHSRQILIANPRLEFLVTRCKQTSETISNGFAQ
jgi:hypothetical protein